MNVTSCLGPVCGRSSLISFSGGTRPILCRILYHWTASPKCPLILYVVDFSADKVPPFSRALNKASDKDGLFCEEKRYDTQYYVQRTFPSLTPYLHSPLGTLEIGPSFS